MKITEEMKKDIELCQDREYLFHDKDGVCVKCGKQCELVEKKNAFFEMSYYRMCMDCHYWNGCWHQPKSIPNQALAGWGIYPDDECYWDYTTSAKERELINKLKRSFPDEKEYYRKELKKLRTNEKNL